MDIDRIIKMNEEELKYFMKDNVHKYKFVDYENGVHTQNIESNNNKIKLKIKEMRGIKENC